jgi:hypothetical protein
MLNTYTLVAYHIFTPMPIESMWVLTMAAMLVEGLNGTYSRRRLSNCLAKWCIAFMKLEIEDDDDDIDVSGITGNVGLKIHF